MKSFTYLYIILLVAGHTVSAQNFQWAKQLSGPGSNALGSLIEIDKVGNIYTVGDFSGTIDFDPGTAVYNLTSSSTTDYYIHKLDDSGNFIWAKQFGGPGNIAIRGFAIDTFCNLYLTGGFNGTVDFDPGAGIHNLSSLVQNDGFIIKLDSTGNLVWVKQFGSTDDDDGLSVTITDNDVLVTGRFELTVDFDPGSGTYDLTSGGGTDMFILKLDSSGAFIWAHKEGSANDDVPFSVKTDDQGYGYVSGLMDNTITIIKLDGNGNHLWTKQVTGGGSYGASLNLKGGDLFVSGVFSGTSDFDPGIGVFNLTAGTTMTNAFILKLDLSGNFVWVKQIIGSGYAVCTPARIDASGDIYTSGLFSNICDFDPGPQQNNLVSVTNNFDDAFILKLNSSGDFVWAKQFGAKHSDECGEMALDAQGNILVTGLFHDTVDFDPGSSGIYNLYTTTYDRSAFILKLSSTLGIPPTGNKEQNILIYPNPSTGTINVSSPQVIDKIQVTDMLGRVVYSILPDNYLNKIETDVATGVYNVSVISGGVLKTEKVVISH